MINIKNNRRDIIMLELNKENFEEEVLKAEGYVLVDFWGQLVNHVRH